MKVKKKMTYLSCQEDALSS